VKVRTHRHRAVLPVGTVVCKGSNRGKITPVKAPGKGENSFIRQKQRKGFQRRGVVVVPQKRRETGYPCTGRGLRGNQQPQKSSVAHRGVQEPWKGKEDRQSDAGTFGNKFLKSSMGKLGAFVGEQMRREIVKMGSESNIKVGM